jgi:hypothetical protein
MTNAGLDLFVFLGVRIGGLAAVLNAGAQNRDKKQAIARSPVFLTIVLNHRP